MGVLVPLEPKYRLMVLHHGTTIVDFFIATRWFPLLHLGLFSPFAPISAVARASVKNSKRKPSPLSKGEGGRFGVPDWSVFRAANPLVVPVSGAGRWRSNLEYALATGPRTRDVSLADDPLAAKTQSSQRGGIPQNFIQCPPLVAILIGG